MIITRGGSDIKMSGGLVVPFKGRVYMNLSEV